MDVTKIEDTMRRNFKLTNVPVELLRAFKEYCKVECGDVYAIGLFQLMKTKQMYESLVPLLSSILKEIEEIKENSNLSQDNNQSKRRKTFGE